MSTIQQYEYNTAIKYSYMSTIQTYEYDGQNLVRREGESESNFLREILSGVPYLCAPWPSLGAGWAPWDGRCNIQGTFRQQSGNIQGALMKDRIRETFRLS
jgi:hypothetical protein